MPCPSKLFVVFSPLSQGTIDIEMAIGNGGRRLGEVGNGGRRLGEVGNGGRSLGEVGIMVPSFCLTARHF